MGKYYKTSKYARGVHRRQHRKLLAEIQAGRQPTLDRFGGPGRTGHDFGISLERARYLCHKELADRLGVPVERIRTRGWALAPMTLPR